MTGLIREKTISNLCLRLFSAAWLAALQCGLLPGCGPGGNPPVPGNTGDNGDSGSQIPGNTTGGLPESLQDLAGWWVVQRTDPGGQVAWGHAGVVLNQAGDEASFNMTMDDGAAPILDLHSSGGTARGFWRSSLLEISAVGAAANWQGRISADRAMITGTWTAVDGAREITFHRAEAPDHGITGSWTRSDGAGAVLAFDGRSLLLSVLDAGGNWPVEGRYDVVEVGGPRFTGIANGGFEGLLFAHRTRMHLRLTAGGGMLFDKDAAQSPLNGRWVGGDRRFRGDHPLRSARIVVAVHNALYIHDAWDSGQQLLRSFAAASTASNRYADAVAGWSGEVSAGGSRMVGSWTGWPDWYDSADRTVAPSPGRLTGTWSSISLDWKHHDPSGAIIRSHGTAGLTQSGDHLQISDTDTTGRGYSVNAAWTGDHYEGVWWPAGAPDQASPWRGELLAGGNYLHGTWINGEYSFCRYPILESSQIPTEALGKPLFTLDPYEDALMVFSDAASGIAGTIYRRQDRIDSFAFVTPTGEVQITLDERARPLHVGRGPDTLDFVWTASTTAQVTAVESGVSTTCTLNVDFSDARILDCISLAEALTGRDLTAMRDWVARNPGRVLATVQGNRAMPLLARGLAPTGLGASKSIGVRLAQSADETEYERTRDEVLALSLMTTLAAAGAVVATAAPGISVALSTVVITGVCFTMLGVAGMVLMFLWLLYDRCNPCTLQCFVNCQ